LPPSLPVREPQYVAGAPLAPHRATMIDHLEAWAAQTPQRPFLAERNAAGDWEQIDYGTMLARTRRVAQGLLDAGASVERPIAIVAENSIAHALALFGAQYAGVPTASIAPATARAGGERFSAILAQLTPAAIVDSDLHAYDVAPRDSVDAARATIGPDTIAKIVFTSGSTGEPKGVITTQRMLCANQQSIVQIWHFAREPQTLVDWLPWHHVYGGNKVLGLALASGGTLWIDAGKPTPDGFATTVRNLREIAPTAYFSVPHGLALLAAAVTNDDRLAASLFARTAILCNAGAAVSEHVAARLRERARAIGRDVPLVSCWGTTETAPMATALADLGDPRETIGIAVPGVTIKLAPVEGGDELRVRGPNVTPGYWRDPERTAAAFDAEGFYCSGDAGALIDARSFRFDGRIAENFKLSSATWVNVVSVRSRFLELAAPLVEDIVLSGEGRDELGALVFLDPRVAQGLSTDRIAATLTAALRAARSLPSATIARALVATPPPDQLERTAKGTLNGRAVLKRRSAEVERLHAITPDAAVIWLGRGTVMGMDDTKKGTETDDRVRENRSPAPAPAIDPKHDDRSPLDVAFPPPDSVHNAEQGDR